MSKTVQFEPIAIVGQGCVLPGASDPEELWQHIAAKSVLYENVPAGALGLAEPDTAASAFVSGLVKEAFSDDLDPVCAWSIRAARQAWAEAGRPHVKSGRAGIYVANLAYPSRAHASYAADIWCEGTSGLSPKSVLNASQPPCEIARALGISGPAFSLDAACASSLYALEIACRRLQSDQIDCAVVAGVNAADNLILHIGFEALRALSPTGQSRPFVKGADGLVPSEGAVAVILKRLSDVEPGDMVHGVIRGIGLSNDGRRKGLLAPSGEGQIEAITRAYAMAGLPPGEIDYLECHATGTPTGDGTEVAASASAFAAADDLKIGSLKANTGHLITAAGLASLLKLTGAMHHETLPPTPIDGDLIAEARTGPLSVLTTCEPWVRKRRPRRGAISNFGFGGNNAHLIVEQYEPERRHTPVSSRSPIEEKIAICGVGLRAGQDRGTESVLRRIMNQPLKPSLALTEIGVDPMRARVPPNDLLLAEPQQLAILDVVEEALDGVAEVQSEKTGVFAAMTCASDSARWLLRERLTARFGIQGLPVETEAAKDSIAPPLQAGAVLGAMANMTANRVTYARDFRGRGFAISADNASGLAVLDAAITALRSGEIDLAIVAAADFAREPVRAAALKAIGASDRPGEQAAALILKRQEQADRDGDAVLAMLDLPVWATEEPAAPCPVLMMVFGDAPVAKTIFELGLKTVLSARGQVLTSEGAVPDLTETKSEIVLSVAETDTNMAGRVTLWPEPSLPCPDPLRPPPSLFWAAASNPEALAAKIRQGACGGTGDARVAVIAPDDASLDERLRDVLTQIAVGNLPQGAGIHYGSGAPDGELAFMFTGSAAVYPRMGRGLLSAFPYVRQRLSELDKAQQIAPLLTKASLTEFEQLCAGTLISQAHAILLKDVLGVQPDAALGLSLGESNALFAFRYWRDPGALLDEISEAAMYERHIGGDFETAQTAWGANVPSDWTNWRVQAPVEQVRDQLSAFAGVEITIIYAPDDCMIGGPAEACRALCASIGPRVGTKMSQHLIVHAKAMQPFAETWQRLHTRDIHTGSDVRLYTNAINAAYVPSADVVAEMLTRQALTTVDFPKTVLQAWEDGVRTFVELGPRETLTRSLPKILGDRPHIAVPMDSTDTSDLGQVAKLAAVLFADGREINLDIVAEHLRKANRAVRKRPTPPPVSRPVPYPPPKLPERVLTKTMGSAPDRPGGEVIVPLPSDVVTNVRLAAPPEVDATRPNKVVSGRQPLKPRWPSGPSWDRSAIKASARGKMSEFFGAAFEPQDAYDRQVRLPDEPLLLVDRITGLAAEHGVESTGVIWTETDLRGDPWYNHKGRIRPGPLIECGQADLTLIGWMGADFKNQDERVYRLLGCEITFHEGGLPQAGDTLRFQIEITGHATLSGVRLFFFQYDCLVGDRRVFSVRNGQAGFFSDDELAAGKGVIWDAAHDGAPTASPEAFSPERASQKRAFTQKDVEAWRTGDGLECFGPGFEALASQSRPACLPGDQLEFFEDIVAFDPTGGPWGRGYLKARARVPTDAWFYQGHFHKDPCMPGTLMAEAAVQALEFHAAALGLTLDHDGSVFEPVAGHRADFVCRGQVVPDRDHEVTYEVFVDEVIEGDTPMIFASLLASCDGKKVFHCPRFGLQLRRDWPAARISGAPSHVGPYGESRGDHDALLECADGAPSAAFGQMYARFDDRGSVPRLPQPPYHMMSRVVEVSTRPGEPVRGAQVSAIYDVEPEAWYFTDNLGGTMPFAVLSEIALQPCGWLASHCGFALAGNLRFRNLQGEGQLLAEVHPDCGTLTTTSTLTSFSSVGPMTIVGFEVEVEDASGVRVLDLKTEFGFFPASALARQAGLGRHADFEKALQLPRQDVDETALKGRVASGRLRMLDGVDHFDPMGGTAGLGLIRARQAVDPHSWYFKAHFFQDPVQPGSLGLDALCQLLCRAILLNHMDKGMTKPHLETLATKAPINWTYRGQVMPDKNEVTTVIEITDVDHDPDGILVSARGSLWCDDLRVYQVDPICVRLRDQD